VRTWVPWQLQDYQVTPCCTWVTKGHFAPAATLSLIVGVPLALAINAWPITQLGLRRKPDRIEGLLALEFAPVQLAVVAIALAAGLLFAGHLAADSYACLHGVRSAC
jgi:hypothetical protein